jgi:predicted kinase
MGYPGAGKTNFTRQFSEQYELPCVSEDRIRFELFENPQFTADEQDIIDRIVSYNAEQIMKSRVPLVCDGNYSTQSSRASLQNLAKNNGYRTLTVWVQTDQITAAQRAQNRDRRNPDNKFAFAINAATFKQLSVQLQRPHEKEQFVVISGKHAFKGQSLTVLRKITEMYAQAASKNLETQTPTSQSRGRQLIQ